MFKKSCFAICLLASAASASTDNWEGTFMMSNGSSVCRSSDGISFLDNKWVKVEQSTVLKISRANAKNADDTVELDTTLTPRSFLNALEQTGEVVGIEPPALSELLRPTAQPALGMDSLNTTFQAEHNRLPTGEENAFMTEMLEQSQAPVSGPTVVVETQRINLNVVPATSGQPVRVIETHFVDKHTYSQ